MPLLWWSQSCLLTIPLLVSSSPAVFFSSYSHGSNNYGYVELFNAGAASLQLADFGLVIRGSEVEVRQLANGLLQPGAYYVLAHQLAGPLILDIANETYPDLLVGRRAFAITYHPAESDFTLLDSIGYFGDYSGFDWSLCGNFSIAAEMAFLRKASVIAGNQGNWQQSRGFDADSCEWEPFPAAQPQIHTFKAARPAEESKLQTHPDPTHVGLVFALLGVAAAAGLLGTAAYFSWRYWHKGQKLHNDEATVVGRPLPKAVDTAETVTGTPIDQVESQKMPREGKAGGVCENV